MNDPNGLCYDENDEKWHLSYQYQKDVMPYGGYCYWGDAESNDLIHWHESSSILSPDKYGIIASGCAVIDKNNTTGLFESDGLPEKRFYVVYTSMDFSVGRQTIGAAYSCDGINYVRYNGGAPILFNTTGKNIGDFRDPKIMAYDGGWLMLVGGGILNLYYSDNLIDWSYQSSVKNVRSADERIDEKLLVLKKYLPNNDPFGVYMISECPDIFQIKCGDEIKCVISGGGLFYVVGRIEKIEGKYEFVCETEKLPFYESHDFSLITAKRMLRRLFITEKRKTNSFLLADG